MNASTPLWLGLGVALVVMVATLALLATLQWGSSQHRQRLAHLSEVGFAELFLFLDGRSFLRINLLALLLVPAGVFVWLGWGAALGAFVLVLFAPGLSLQWLRSRRRRALQRQLPDAAAGLTSALRGGLSLSQGLEQVVKHQPKPIAQEFALMLREHRIGVPLDQALTGMADRVQLRDLDLLVSTLAIARDLGGGLAEALERYAQSVRRRLALEERIRALTAQGRLQGMIMGLLPIFLGAVLMWIDPTWMRPLFSTTAGYLTLAVILVLELIGFVLIRKIIDIRI